jgi:hypothetical protein
MYCTSVCCSVGLLHAVGCECHRTTKPDRQGALPWVSGGFSSMCMQQWSKCQVAINTRKTLVRGVRALVWCSLLSSSMFQSLETLGKADANGVRCSCCCGPCRPCACAFSVYVESTTAHCVRIAPFSAHLPERGTCTSSQGLPWVRNDSPGPVPIVRTNALQFASDVGCA